MNVDQIAKINSNPITGVCWLCLSSGEAERVSLPVAMVLEAIGATVVKLPVITLQEEA